MRKLLVGRSPATYFFFAAVAIVVAVAWPAFNPVGYFMGTFYLIRGLMMAAKGRRSSSPDPYSDVSDGI